MSGATTTNPARLTPAETTGVGGLLPLLDELGDHKRIRVAGRPGSLAEQAFSRGWRRLVAGEDSSMVAAQEVARNVAATRLGGIDATVLATAGLSRAEALGVLERGFDAVTGGLDVQPWRSALSPVPVDEAGLPPAPPAVRLLADQPRAGATAPGLRRVLVEPPESHGDHCWAAGVYGALLAPVFGADPAQAWLLGLAHHPHNALLPDAGFAGEVLLGGHLDTVLSAFTARTLDELAEPLRALVVDVLAERAHADSPLARAFHAADVLDRVLQVHHHARAAAFTAAQALDDLDLVHAGPVQAFHLEVLQAAGL